MTDFNAMDVAELTAVIEGHRPAVRAVPPALIPDFAEASLALAAKLAETESFELALMAAVEGVDHLRLLFKDQPAEYAVHVASALNNLSNRLTDLGRDEEARAAGDEAFTMAKRELLDGGKPAEARFVLVSTLMNQSGRSWRANQPLRAIEELGTAVDYFREGGESLSSFLGLMLEVLHRNAMALAESGLWAEAIAVRRMAVDVFPKDEAPLAILHVLALTLQQGAMALTREGMFGQALPLVEEAADLARDLAETEPAQYRLFLAQSLANLAGRQHEAGANDQALEAIIEAVTIFQELAKENGAEVLEALIPTLDTFASILTQLGNDGLAATIVAQRDQLLAAVQAKGE